MKQPKSELYTTGAWNGITQYRCAMCAWDTVEGEAEMLKHIEDRHMTPPVKESVIQVYDRFGNPVKE